MTKIKKPSALKPGDTIRIVASSSPFDRQALLDGIRLIKKWGFKPKYQKNIFAQQPYLAGSDARRARELITALKDHSTQAIFFARGGYGAMRILPHLDKINPCPRPKIIMGYSDITALLVYFYSRYGWITFYGPVVAKDIHPTTPKHSLQFLHHCLTSCAELGELKFAQAVCLKAGKVTAPMVGGCLSLLVSLLGTPYELNTDGKILFLEDVNEKPYEVDRMMTHLRLAGKLEKCAGLVFGSLNGPNPTKHYIQTIKDIVSSYNFPVLFNVPAGHCKNKITLPLGIRVHLNAAKKSLIFLEPALT